MSGWIKMQDADIKWKDKESSNIDWADKLQSIACDFASSY
jgi:hypothetical protein